ncbi:hypothetical protein AURDEDRAFT_181832 [Auricularia subglabra TFB-10046 SS5]|nr:hypothetical protein AURDEDRAFT_181832 [Auricularia subglabra TFB-10046 SS5]
MPTVFLPVQPRGEEIGDLSKFANITLNVGTTQVYNLTAAASDFVIFHFPSDNAQGNHSMVQTTFEQPCTFLRGGFSSGLHPPPNSDFRVQLLHDYPIYFACVAHCHEGEVGALNTRRSAPFEALVEAAKRSVVDFSHVKIGATKGGEFGAVVIGPGDTNLHVVPQWAYILGILVAIALFAAVGYCGWTILRKRTGMELKEWQAMRRLVRRTPHTLDPDRTLVDTAPAPPPQNGPHQKVAPLVQD